MMAQKKQVSGGVSSTSHTDNGGSKMDFKSIMKDIEFLGNLISHAPQAKILFSKSNM